MFAQFCTVLLQSHSMCLFSLWNQKVSFDCLIILGLILLSLVDSCLGCPRCPGQGDCAALPGTWVSPIARDLLDEMLPAHVPLAVEWLSVLPEDGATGAICGVDDKTSGWVGLALLCTPENPWVRAVAWMIVKHSYQRNMRIDLLFLNDCSYFYCTNVILLTDLKQLFLLSHCISAAQWYVLIYSSILFLLL